MSLSGELIYDGKSYAVFQRYRFGLRHPMLCTFVAILKEPAAMVPATFSAKAYLVAVVGELTKLGARPGADEFEVLFERFAQAVFARGYVTWQAFFCELSAAETARELPS